MDDDGQNPPGEILKMLDKASRGHDTVFGKFRTKEASFTRKLGSFLVTLINRRVFHQPQGLSVSNHRLLHHSVVKRILSDKTAFPYITGQALLHSANPADVEVEHRARSIGSSGYTLGKIAKLLLNILFSYSVWPLRYMAIVGGSVALMSFLAAAVYLALGIFRGTSVPGWTTLVVLVGALGGITIALLSMLGEYVIRILVQTRDLRSYVVSERVDDDK